VLVDCDFDGGVFVGATHDDVARVHEEFVDKGQEAFGILAFLNCGEIGFGVDDPGGLCDLRDASDIRVGAT